MKKYAFALSGGLLLFCSLAAQPEEPLELLRITASAGAASSHQVLQEFCVRCHGETIQQKGLSFATFDVAAAGENAEIAERMIRKLRTGLMPPAGQRRPSDDMYLALVEELEASVDRAAIANPNPGRRTFQRLNRAEYTNSIRDLLGIEVDVAAFLPPDTISHGFDNIADVQMFSATTMQGYLRAASEISRLAVGDPEAVPSEATYKIPRTASQLNRVAGAPFGTRGGTSIVHNFPADGDYVFKGMMHSGPTGFLFGTTAKVQELEISIDGMRVAVLKVDRFMHEQDSEGMTMATDPIAVRSGPHRVTAAFIKQWDGPVEDVIAPIEHTLADTQIGSAYGITTLPHLRDFIVSGPYDVTGLSDTPSRRIIFTARPISADDELPVVTSIISHLAARAYRRPITGEDLQGLMAFYETGATEGDFESGIRMALQAILASPHFVFRLEEVPDDTRPGENYRITDVNLASRLSYFLWASIPDEELMSVARQGKLSDPAVLEQQVRRMLGDQRAETLATRFAAQWLRLQDLEKVHPDALNYPQYDQTLGQTMRRETELFFENLVREDRNILELLTADYTFVDERLARHYGIADVAGDFFRRVTLEDENRRGLLGQGSFLTQTSHANRTSPVLRGKWVMEVLLGSPPPPPPPDVPEFDETDAVGDGRLLTVRERLELHRASPACNSCHRMIDPIGVALDNFDVTGAWRIKDSFTPIDAASEFYDGTQINGPVDLRNALLKRPEAFIRTFIQNLMTYGLGRRIEYFDMPTIRAIAREAAENDNRISTIILGLVKSDAFQMSRAESTNPPGEQGR